MSEATGLVLHFTRCSMPAYFEEWGAWMREVHLPDLHDTEGIRAATFWPLTQQRSLQKRGEALRESGRIHPSHCLIDVDCLEAHGRWNRKPMPSEMLEGHILAYVMCNDPQLEEEWDRWNDEVHMPDMMDSGAFTAVSRWLRQPKNDYGTNYLTLYDVGEGGVGLAVERSAAVMPGLARAGRKMDCHVAGLTFTLGPE